jgi:hypothetical protein
MKLDNMLWLWFPDLVPSSVRNTIRQIITKLSAEGILAPHIKEVDPELN